MIAARCALASVVLLGCGARTSGELGDQPAAVAPSCAALASTAAENTSTCPGGSVDPTGGTIADGAYEVIAYHLYASACGSYLRVARESITFAAGTVADAVDVTRVPFGTAGVGPASATFAFTTHGDTLTLSPTCKVLAPDTEALTTVLEAGDYQFSASPDAIQLFIPASPPRLFAELRRIR